MGRCLKYRVDLTLVKIFVRFHIKFVVIHFELWINICVWNAALAALIVAVMDFSFPSFQLFDCDRSPWANHEKLPHGPWADWEPTKPAAATTGHDRLPHKDLRNIATRELLVDCKVDGNLWNDYAAVQDDELRWVSLFAFPSLLFARNRKRAKVLIECNNKPLKWFESDVVCNVRFG